MSKATQLSPAKQAILARYLRGDLPRTQTHIDTIPRRPQGSSAPLSFGQQQMWLLEQIITSPVYNESVTLRIPGQLDVPTLERSLNAFIQRHEVWRTTFPLADDGPIQLIHPELQLRLSEVDLRTYPQAEREVEAIRLATEQAQPRFDLTELPLLRATLIHLDDADHRLYLTLHHIIFDGTIYEVFLPELYAHYEAFARGEASPLAPLTIQYADFALWQHERLKDDLLAEQLAYWKRQLANAPTVLQLPTDRPRPPVLGYHGKRLPFFLSREITDALRNFGQQEGVTLYMLLTAAFQVMLSRYSGQTDILMSTTTAGRSHRDLRQLIGLFLNNLVLRTDLSGNPTVHELLGRVRDTVLDADAHPDIPFQYLVQELQPERNPAWNPLVQVILSLEPPLPVLPSGWTITQSDVEIGTAKFDLYLELDDRPDGFAAWLEYNTDLFDETTAQRMIGHWSTILAHIVRDPLQHIADLPMLTDAELQQLLVTWNETGTVYAQEQCVQQLFEAQVRNTPTTVAAICEESSLTYQELNARANQLAHYLQSIGVGPEVLVAICIERSLAMLVALLGILKAGGAYVPLDPSYPAERIAFMLEDAHVAVLVTQQSLMAQLPVHDAQVVCMDTDQETIAQLSEDNPATPVQPEQLAFVIYTSGSTGRPKGVQIPHRALTNFLLSMRQEPGLSADDTLLAVTTLSFDIASLELYLPLIVGAHMVIASRDVATSGTALAQTLAQTHTTVMQATPITWRMLLAAGWQGDQQLKVLCTGEALPLELAQQLAPKVAACYNMYGPTETTIESTLSKIEADASSITVGRPIANTTIYILDQYLQPVPVGMPGELYIGGYGLARGYLHRPELTAERFIHHPFSSNPTERIYRTGDLARYRTDGTIEIIGRIDHQVKLRGFRIELGEIESVLAQYPAVQQAVAIVREDQPGNKRLVAYLRLHDGQEVTLHELQQQAMAYLPAYMVPSTFVFLDALPQTPNGKVDRRALPIPDQTRPELHTSFVAPRSTLEELVANVWAKVLHLPHVGIHDNFFALGGHSLLATQVNSQLHTALHIELPLRRFFDAPTVAQFTELIVQQQANGTPAIQAELAAQPRLKRKDNTVLLPASLGQQPLWFIDQMEPGNTAYNIPVTMRLHKPLDMQALQRSLNTLVQQHEALRTRFTFVDGQVMQVIATQLEITIALLNLQNRPFSERETTAHTLALQEAQRPFALAEGPLLRATVLQLAADDAILLLVMHHSISDGWSINLLRRDIVNLYDAFARDETVSLPALPVQFADFAHWQRTVLQGEVLTNQLAYWKQHLAGAPTLLQLPTDRPRLANPTYRGAMHSFTLTKELNTALKMLSRQENVTLYMTLVAAFVILLQRYAGQEDLLLGTTVAGRSRSETEEMFGYFINTLVLRVDLSGQPSVHEILQRVRETTLNAHTHQNVPFDMLVKELQPDRTLGQSPLFQAFLTLDPPLPEISADWDLTPLDIATGGTKFDLSLDLTEQPQGIIGYLEYSTDLFDASTIARMARHWETLLQAMVDDPTQQLATLPLLTDTERQQLLVEWNATQTLYSTDVSLAQLFVEQVKRTPTASAVTFENSTLTYQDLNAQANQFAHYLRSIGVGPDVLVAICIERSLAMLVALFGILKAGGAYVPLDPSYPAERIAFMLEDAHVAVLVTQQSLVAQLPVLDAQVICMDTDRETIAQLSTSNPATLVQPEHLAYVIYTSGSTGRPKGVQIPHRALTNFLLSMRQEPGLSADDTLLAVTTLSFDIAGLELYLPLIVGARLVIASHDVATSGTALAQTLAQTQTTVMQATPITWRMLLAAGWQGDQQLKVLCGGEALPLELAQQLAPKVAACYNMYGPTETTIWSTLSKIEANASSITVGRPIANTTIYILDQQLQPVPVGTPGELYIGGAGLARGYLHRPELTAERFIRHPFSNNAAERIYRTGDLARYHTDGTIEIIGRIDHQVKLRGFRIELGEIESVLEQHSAIKQAIAIVREDKPGDKRLVAYIVSDSEVKLLRTDLRAMLTQQLPAYMLPSDFVFMDTLPLTNNGKIDRKALPAPDHEQSVEEKNMLVVPTQIAHYQLLTIWEELLSTRPIGIRDNFFHLGGHSLLAARLVVRIEQVFGKKLSLSTIFAGPTIEQLATILQKQEGPATRQTSLMPVQTAGSKPPFFFLHGDWTGGAFYCFTLSRHAGTDQPFYALEPFSFDGMQTFPTIEQLAATYVEQIRNIQPEGPYSLGGYCNGGLFAYEIARQLQAAGQHVELLSLLIPSSPKKSIGLHTLINSFGNVIRLKHDQKARLYLRLRHMLRHIYRHARPHDVRVADFAKLLAVDSRLASMFPPMNVLYKDYIGVFSQIISRYSSGTYSGKATFIWPKEELSLKNSWHGIATAQEVEEMIVPGTHITMVTDHIEALAQHMSASIKSTHSSKE